MNNVLELSNIVKDYYQAKEILHVLQGVSLKVKEGEVVALLGPSGCGKSTLLQLAGLLDNAQSGNIKIKGQECTLVRDKQATELRGRTIGFVYQFHHLLPEFSALENVMLPQMFLKKKRKEAAAKATKLLERLELGDRLNHRPAELSGGQQQRVAIARALANDPKIILADEPTGNLDPQTSQIVFSVLLEQVKEKNVALLFASHDRNLAQKADRVLTIDKGKLVTGVL